MTQGGTGPRAWRLDETSNDVGARAGSPSLPARGPALLPGRNRSKGPVVPPEPYPTADRSEVRSIPPFGPSGLSALHPCSLFTERP